MLSLDAWLYLCPHQPLDVLWHAKMLASRYLFRVFSAYGFAGHWKCNDQIDFVDELEPCRKGEVLRLGIWNLSYLHESRRYPWLFLYWSYS